MRNKTGGVARGSDFFPRPQVTAELVHLVERDHLLLLAPRRSGKTSLMIHIEDHPPPGWTVIYADVESAADEAAFVARLLGAVRAKNPVGASWTLLPERVAELVGRIGKVQAGPVEVQLAGVIGADWRDVGRTLARLLAKSQPLLLMIDEFPIFVQRLLDAGDDDRARLFLDWFRALRQGHDVHEAGARFLLAGSIGLDAVVTRAGLTSTINDLQTYRLGPLDASEVRRFLDALAQGEGVALPADVAARFAHHIRYPVPFHLQLLFSEVHRAHRFRHEPLTVELVDRSYEVLLGPDKRKHFSHWVERLLVDGPAEQAYTRDALVAAARDPQGAPAHVLRQLPAAADVDVDALLWGLEHDGYLARDGARWRFASSLLRDWWLRWQVRA